MNDDMIRLVRPCPYCGARYVGKYGLPHFCKERTFCSMPVRRFEQFEVRPAGPQDMPEFEDILTPSLRRWLWWTARAKWHGPVPW